jgi:hypothetical protein
MISIYINLIESLRWIRHLGEIGGDPDKFVLPLLGLLSLRIVALS